MGDFTRRKNARSGALQGISLGRTRILAAGDDLRLVSDDYLWHGFHPFNELNGADAVADRFWAPLHASLTSLQRRLDIFLAGDNRIEGHEGVWVASMGHLMGLFDTRMARHPADRQDRHASLCRVPSRLTAAGSPKRRCISTFRI